MRQLEKRTRKKRTIIKNQIVTYSLQMTHKIYKFFYNNNISLQMTHKKIYTYIIIKKHVTVVWKCLSFYKVICCKEFEDRKLLLILSTKLKQKIKKTKRHQYFNIRSSLYDSLKENQCLLLMLRSILFQSFIRL